MIAGVALISVTSIVYYGSGRESMKQSNGFSPDDEETNAKEIKLQL